MPQQQYDADTPPGGVWVPHQRGADFPPPPDQQQPAPYPYEQQQPGPGYDERYRY